jgi:hypothetical protein
MQRDGSTHPLKGPRLPTVSGAENAAGVSRRHRDGIIQDVDRVELVALGQGVEPAPGYHADVLRNGCYREHDSGNSGWKFIRCGGEGRGSYRTDDKNSHAHEVQAFEKIRTFVQRTCPRHLKS